MQGAWRGLSDGAGAGDGMLGGGAGVPGVVRGAGADNGPLRRHHEGLPRPWARHGPSRPVTARHGPSRPVTADDGAGR